MMYSKMKLAGAIDMHRVLKVLSPIEKVERMAITQNGSISKPDITILQGPVRAAITCRMAENHLAEAEIMERVRSVTDTIITNTGLQQVDVTRWYYSCYPVANYPNVVERYFHYDLTKGLLCVIGEPHVGKFEVLEGKFAIKPNDDNEGQPLNPDLLKGGIIREVPLGSICYTTQDVIHRRGKPSVLTGYRHIISVIPKDHFYFRQGKKNNGTGKLYARNNRSNPQK